MTTINDLPKEIIELIANKLTCSSDLYNGLFVCRLWYPCFCRSLYRDIHIVNRRQFLKWLPTIQYRQTTTTTTTTTRRIHFGPNKTAVMYRPDDYVDGSVPPHSIELGMTSHELNTILSSFPFLQSFHFDSRLWSFLNLDIIKKNTMRLLYLDSLPPLDHPRQFTLLMNKGGLTRLHLRGSDVFYLHETNELLLVFDQTPMLTHLKMDGDGIWDTEYTMSFSVDDMELLFSKLPLLQELVILDVMRLTASELPSFVQPSFHLKRLQLSTTLQLDQESNDHQEVWFKYFAQKYPVLSYLDLNIKVIEPITLSSRRLDKSLVTLINSLHQLKCISIQHGMEKQFVNDNLLALISKKHPTLEDFKVSLPDAALLDRLSDIPSLSQLNVPIRHNKQFRYLDNLAYLAKLVDLTLSCVRGRTGGGTATETGKSDDIKHHQMIFYPIQTIFETCPHLLNLELSHGHIMDKVDTPLSLKKLRMNHVTIHADTNLFNACRTLDILFLRACHFAAKPDIKNKESITKRNSFLIDLSELDMETVILSELTLNGSDKLTAINVTKEKSGSRWYREIQHRYSFRFYLQRMHILHTEECHVAFTCKSANNIIFNGCKI